MLLLRVSFLVRPKIALFQTLNVPEDNISNNDGAAPDIDEHLSLMTVIDSRMAKDTYLRVSDIILGIAMYRSVR